MFCRNCGKELADDAKFCVWCGTQFMHGELEKAPEAAPVMSVQAKKNNGRLWGIGAAIVVVLLGIAFIGKEIVKLHQGQENHGEKTAAGAKAGRTDDTEVQESKKASGSKTENSVVREDKSPQESTTVDDVLEENTTQLDYFDSTPFEQRYWVIFTEGYRNDRVEASAFDSTLPAEQLAIIWKSALEINDSSGSDGCAQYYLDDNGEWIYMRNYHRLSDKATNVLASNLDVVDSNGNVIISATPYSMIDWDENEKKEKDGTNDDIITENIPEDAVEYNGHYYYLYTGSIASTYEEAAQYCNSNGGYLATLTSQEENDFVYSYILQQGIKNAYFGLSDSASEGNWEWCTGEPLDYTNWHKGEPNSENSNEDYALFYYKFSDGAWNDGDFNRRTVKDGDAFICEWGDFSS